MEEGHWFYDCHCHVFNRNEINLRLISQLFATIPEVLPDRDLRGKKQGEEPDRQRKSELVRKLQNFMMISMTGTHQDVFSLMQSVYGPGVRIVPLMFDIESAFNNKRIRAEDSIETLSDESRNLEQKKIRTGISDFRKKMLKMLTGPVAMRSSGKSPAKTGKTETLQTKLSDYLTRFRQKNLDQDSFDLQMADILKLKADYPERVFPFISIDPRRPQVISRFMGDESFRKDFSGVKLYTPNGYSPTDPELYNPGGLYEFCALNGIPVTVHHSYAGFATPLEEVEICGDIFMNGKVTPVNGNVTFSRAFSSRWVQDRADKLNHPELWRKVIETYPRLKLNLAHFGHQNPYWQEMTVNMIRPDNNLYTDLSCFVNKHELISIRARFFSLSPTLMSTRLLYGSDYYLNLLFSPSFEEYYRNFRQVFTDSEFDQIARVNVERFLGL